MPATRRQFSRSALGAAAALCSRGSRAQTDARPNILWITCEDMSPDLGCYGDAWARTPSIDRLASQGARFTNAFSVAGVCAPSRSAIITGMYPSTIGTHHMRSKGVPPPQVKCFSEYLRAAGYYCTNNVKTDYNFDCPLTAWDETSRTAHWRGRAQGQPFIRVDGGDVRMDCATEGASIAYTFEAGENFRWKLYSRLVTPDRSATLRARACRLGYRDSPETRAEVRVG